MEIVHKMTGPAKPYISTSLRAQDTESRRHIMCL